MRRHAGLRSLSSEHHSGLVIARRARRAASAAPPARVAAWEEVKQRFRRELEPHFQHEEHFLLPLLREAGETALVERTEREHAALRLMLSYDDANNLHRFAQLLAEHIRFEEQELFESAQRLLTPVSLATLAQGDE
jgi:hemerythrin-like domain-containing protein